MLGLIPFPLEKEKIGIPEISALPTALPTSVVFLQQLLDLDENHISEASRLPQYPALFTLATSRAKTVIQRHARVFGGIVASLLFDLSKSLQECALSR